ncbi:MAG TPA: MarR family transcriptional regulator [Hyphomicrobiales bacterium]|nr:MarR family transcriptional regulator [Hyphomicrobiales bacterium]
MEDAHENGERGLANAPKTAGELAPRSDIPEPTVAAKLLIVGNFWRRSGNAYYQALGGVSLTEVLVLSLLERRSPQSLNAISAQVGLDKTQMSRAVKRLVERGLVIHTKSAREGKPRGLSLSEEGYATHMALRPAVDRRLRALIAGLSDKEIAAFERTLDMLLDNVRGLRAPT